MNITAKATIVVAGLVALLAGVLFWSAIWTGLAISYLWALFVSPFFSLPEISIAQAFGFALLVRVCGGPNRRGNDNKDDSANFAVSLLLPPSISILAILFGWAVSHFI